MQMLCTAIACRVCRHLELCIHSCGVRALASAALPLPTLEHPALIQRCLTAHCRSMQTPVNWNAQLQQRKSGLAPGYKTVAEGAQDRPALDDDRPPTPPPQPPGPAAPSYALSCQDDGRWIACRSCAAEVSMCMCRVAYSLLVRVAASTSQKRIFKQLSNYGELQLHWWVSPP